MKIYAYFEKEFYLNKVNQQGIRCLYSSVILIPTVKVTTAFGRPYASDKLREDSDFIPGMTDKIQRQIGFCISFLVFNLNLGIRFDYNYNNNIKN
jgi:hypothetical protein